MLSKSAIVKVKALFIIDVIIVAMAAGTFLYLQSTGQIAVATSKPAEFTLSNLTIDPPEAGIGQPILISVNVTNIGDEEGSYSANLTVNDVPKESHTVLLPGGNSSTVEFTDAENAEGTFTVKISDLNGTFIITNKPPPSSLAITNLINTPYEAWANEPVTMAVNVTNTGNEPIRYSLPFKVNGVIRTTKAIQLAAGETKTIEANVTETSEGTYSVIIGGLHGSFIIVQTGYHTLKVIRSGSGSRPMTFTRDGISFPTPYSELLPVGMHTVVVQALSQTPTALFQFVKWSDGDTNTEKKVDLQSYTALVTTYIKISGVASCPSLYVWNGTNYVYRTEVSGSTGYLPYFVSFGENGTPVYGYTYPWDYIKLDNSQIQTKNGYYDMTLTQLWDEIFYLDSAQLLVVDHSPNVDVYSTMGTKKYNLKDKGTIYTVSENPSKPISAVNGTGDVMPQISKLDGVTTIGTQFKWNTLELNMGNLSNAQEIKLIVVGSAVWPSNEESGEWIGKFVNQPGVEPYPAQYMEIKDANGNWVRVPDNRQFPMLDVDPTLFILNLTGLFPTNDYSLRINTFFDTRFDYIGVDTTPQQNLIIHTINPASADFTQAFEPYATSTGNFTRYGNVTELMLNADDKFVIGRLGDEIHLKFDSAGLGEVPPGMERDYFFFVSCWFKSPGLPYLAFAVAPIPFHAMSAFPYPPTESYPTDAIHMSYLIEYNTRAITILDVEARLNDIIPD